MNTRFKMAEMNSAEAAKLLRNLCEATQATSKNWDNMEAMFKLYLDAALKAGAEYMRERAAKEAEREDIQYGKYPEDAAPYIRTLTIPD